MGNKTTVYRGMPCSHPLLSGQSEPPAAAVLDSACERRLKFFSLSGSQNKNTHTKSQAFALDVDDLFSYRVKRDEGRMCSVDKFDLRIVLNTN